MSQPSPGRIVATRVLFRIAQEGAWASPALDSEIARAHLAPRDAALATEIVYGTLRVLPQLDRLIEARQTKKGGLEPVAQAALRAAAYQLQHLSGAPSHAVVSDAVSIVRERRGDGLSKFVNAVARGLATARPENPERPTALEVSPWIAQAVERGLGPERARRYLATRALPPPHCIRVNGDRITRDELATRIAEERPHGRVAITPYSPLGIVLSNVGDLRTLASWEEGLFVAQDEGSQLVALAVEAGNGDEVADTCAGRGGKTTLVVSQVGATGKVTAMDIHERKLEQIHEELNRLGLDSSRLDTLALDVSVGVGGMANHFDRVLVDAPCTGLGTIHRRPELLLRLGAGDPARMAKTQLRILQNAAKMVRSGGTLIYAVCSPTREEGPEVVEQFLATEPTMKRVPSSVGGLQADDDDVLRIGPFEPDSSCDVYQLVRFVRS